MALFISSLNSGSNGNAYYIGNETEAILVDAGISCREIEKRITRSGLAMDKIKAIFISHEHSDHIRGLERTAHKFKLPVYITDATLKFSYLNIDSSLIRPLMAYEQVTVGKLRITAFPKSHDASDAHSFIVECGGIKAGVFTDIGVSCENVIMNFKQCNAAFLEANYDEKMLDEGSYPPYLKKRIRSDKGHLSNEQALQLFTKNKPVFMSHLLLAHLSKENNDPELVKDLFLRQAGKTQITVASRYKESEVFKIEDQQCASTNIVKSLAKGNDTQLTLF